MTAYWENSFVYRILITLLHWLSASGVARLYYKIEGFIIRLLKGSVVCTFLARPGRITGAWEASITCRLLEWIANIVPRFLRWLFHGIYPAMDNSVVFRTVVIGESIPVLLSWFFLLMMVCPHDYWNNFYSLAFGVVCVVLCYCAAIRQPSLRLSVKSFNPYLWAFFFMLCIGVLESVSVTTSVRYLTYFISAILLTLLVVSAVSDTRQFKRIAAFGAAGIPVAAAYGVYQRVVEGLENTSSTVDMTLNADMPGRVYSFFDNANTFAQVLVMMIGMTLGLLFASRTIRGKLLSLASLACGLLAIAMTYSRASWIGLVVTVFIFILLAERRLIPVLIIGVVAMLPVLPASIYNRILTIFDFSDSSTSSRFPIYSVGLKIWEGSPITGVGLGSELSAKIAHRSGWYFEKFKFPHYHNVFLQLAVELGLLGLFAYVAGFISACKETVRAVFSAECDRDVRNLTVGCLSGLVGVMVCGLADYFWHYPRVMAIFWLIFGLMLCGAKLGKQKK